MLPCSARHDDNDKAFLTRWRKKWHAGERERKGREGWLPGQTWHGGQEEEEEEEGHGVFVVQVQHRSLPPPLETKLGSGTRTLQLIRREVLGLLCNVWSIWVSSSSSSVHLPEQKQSERRTDITFYN